MPRRYLFGPVTAEFAEQHLHKQRRSGECLAFDAEGKTDLAIGLTDTWDDVCQRLPAGWRPDFIALFLRYTTIPLNLWTASVPLVGLASDWNLLWHAYRNQLASCDLILTDTAGVDAFKRQGLKHACFANLYGCGRAFLEEPVETQRDIDILFVGNLHPAVQRQRLAWSGRISRLAARFQVAIRTGVFGADYRQLLRRAKIVFNRSIRDECNQRVFEALASGALLFQEAGNREVAEHFRDRQECVYYTDENLEELLTYYLENEEERNKIAAAAQAKAASFSFENIWQETVEGPIKRKWRQLIQRSRRRPSLNGEQALLSRTWQLVSSTDGGDCRLEADLAA